MHIGRASWSGSVQSIFSAPARRSAFAVSPSSVPRRAVTLKMLCIIVGFLFLATKDVITYRSRITVVNLSNSLLDKEPIFLSLPRFTFLEFRFQLLDRGKITPEI